MGRIHGSVIVALIVFLSGCTAPPVPTASPSASASSETDELGAVLATGTLLDAAGAAIGDVEIRSAAHGTSELVISNYEPVAELVSARLYLEPLMFDECFDMGPAVASGDLSADSAQTFVLGDFDDLPFEPNFPALGLMTLTTPTEESDCLLRVVAIADLTWTNSSASVPTDWQPVDSGPRAGAMGTTTVDADGIPLTYLVASGDTPDAIRERFDLYWSSLARADGTAMPKYTTIYVDEVLTFVPPLPVPRDK